MNQLIDRATATSRVYGGKSKKGKVGQAVALLGFSSTALSLYRSVKEEVDGKFFYTATIPQDSYVYDEMMEVLNEQMKPGRAYILRSEFYGVRRYYDGNSNNKINIKGADFWFSVEKPESSGISTKVVFDEDSNLKFNKLIFRTRKYANLQVLQDFLDELITKKKATKRDPYVWNPTSNGFEARNLRKRELGSVFMPEGVKEDLVADLENFFNHEKSYTRLGIPYHRGYLFYGPPGNGKSSIAKAIASEYDLHLYNLPLSTLKDDAELMSRISSIQSHSVLLLEDIDIFSKSMSREQSDSGPTLSGLLNALDGVSTPHGLVTFMSTNHIEVLDEALIREGRIDKKIHMVKPDSYQVREMFKFAYDEELGVEPREFSKMAELTGVFKRFTLDPESARMEIKA